MKPREALGGRSDKDVRYGAMRRAAISNTVPVPISPELVLVDPELRRKVLAQLVGDLLLDALPEPGPRSAWVVERASEQAETPEAVPRLVAPLPLSEVLHRLGQAPRRRRRRRLVPALFPVSVALNVILIALSVSDARVARTTPSPPLANDATTPKQVSPATTKPSSTKKQRARTTKQQRARTTKQQRARTTKPAAKARAQKVKRSTPQTSARGRELRGRVEQKVLNAVIQSPAGKLPQALINRSTGLAKNGLQAYCRSEARAASFLCIVRPVRHKPGEGLYVRYRLNKTGNGSAFTWYPYRGG
jgi:hypothetical protein